VGCGGVVGGGGDGEVKISVKLNVF